VPKKPGGGLRAAMRHRDFRYLVAASSISQTGDWLYNVALLVWVYDTTGSAGWVAFVTVARLVPYVVVGPFGGLLADSYDRRTVMVISDLLRATLMFGLAVVTLLDGPVVLAALIAFLATAAGTAYRPAVVAMLPEVVGERDLATANATESVVESLSVVIGPAIGAGLLVVATATFSFALNGVTFLVSGALAAALHVRSRGDAPSAAEATRAGWGVRAIHGFRELSQSRDLLVLGGFIIGTSFIYGLQTVVLVLVASEQLEAGADGVGILYAALGLGGVVGAALVSRFARVARLGAVLYATLLLAAVPMAALALTSSGGPAFTLVMLSSIGVVGLNVLALTQLQRAVGGDVLGRVWGSLDALSVAAIIGGSIVVSPVIDLMGIDSALVILTLMVPAFGLLGVVGLRRTDREAVELLERIGPAVAAFEQVPILERADRAVIERLATAAVVQSVPIGTDVVVQGEPAEHFYVVESGRLDVFQRRNGGVPEPVNVLGAGDWFGEVGLVRELPRNATVRARWPSRVWCIDGAELLEAINSAPTQSAAHVEGMAGRIGADR
jgi:MFS family permease